MKIGFDVAQTCSERAGCAWYADSLIRAMVQQAPEHHYFLYHQFGDWINSNTENGTQIVADNVTPTFLDVTPQEAARIWKSPDELVIKTGAPDIIHANSFRAPKVPGAKLVFTVYDVSFWAKPQYSTESNRLVCQQGILEALANADGYIFISQSARDEFENYLPGWLSSRRTPWIITHLSTRHQGWEPTKNPAANYWLTVGSLEPRKNYETLLKAYSVYMSRSLNPLVLKIAGGRGWKNEKLFNQLHDLRNCGAEIEFLGYVDDKEMPQLYSNARALIFPSYYEGFGLPILEAMTCGSPVICGNNSSLPEVAGSAAYYTDITDPDQIAEAMLRLENSDDEYQKHRTKSIKQSSLFSWESTAASTLAFYRKLLMHSD